MNTSSDNQTDDGLGLESQFKMSTPSQLDSRKKLLWNTGATSKLQIHLTWTPLAPGALTWYVGRVHRHGRRLLRGSLHGMLGVYTHSIYDKIRGASGALQWYIQNYPKKAQNSRFWVVFSPFLAAFSTLLLIAATFPPWSVLRKPRRDTNKLTSTRNSLKLWW